MTLVIEHESEPDDPGLGDRCRFVEAGDIDGVVVGVTYHLDGSVYYDVRTWIDGERKVLTVHEKEVRLA